MTFHCEPQTVKIPTQQGVFGASMKVELLNNGPATFWLVAMLINYIFS